MHEVNKLSFSLLLEFSEQRIMWQKNNKPFTDFESLIDLQEGNSLDVGRVLHSKTIAVNIIDHVSSQMKKKILN